MTGTSMTAVEGILCGGSSHAVFGGAGDCGAARSGTPPPGGREAASTRPGVRSAADARPHQGRRVAALEPSGVSPRCEVVWTARAAGVIAGSDRYLDGTGAMEWRLAGMVALAHGTDVTRSAAGWASCTPTPKAGCGRWPSTGRANSSGTRLSS